MTSVWSASSGDLTDWTTLKLLQAMVHWATVRVSCLVILQWGTADVEISNPSVENPELTNVLPLRPGVGQNIATHAVSAARDVLLLFFSVCRGAGWGVEGSRLEALMKSHKPEVAIT